MAYMAKVSGFDRTNYGDEKGNYYPTDERCCEMINSLLEFPEEDVYFLEPCCGLGIAGKIVSGKEEGDKKHLFAVELNSELYSGVRKDKAFESVLNADFITQTQISRGGFSLVFCNPPYTADLGDGNKRMETSFLEKIVNVLSVDGLCIWVVRTALFTNAEHNRTLMHWFDVERAYRFPDEASGFDQVVLFLRRRQRYRSLSKEEVEEFTKTYSGRANYKVLDGYDETIKVHRSTGQLSFKSSHLEPEAASETVSSMLASGSLDELFGENFVMRDLSEVKDANLPIEPKSDLKIVAMINGYGGGKIGEDTDPFVHYVRGNYERVETEVVDEEEGNNDGKKKEKSAKVVVSSTMSAYLTLVVPHPADRKHIVRIGKREEEKE